MTLEVGGQLDGRYELVRLINEGGFGRVFEATQLSTGQQVAIKVLRADRLAPDRADVEIRRFRRELRAIAQLRHPHIVQLLDSGRDPSGALYAVLTYIDGPSLAQVLRADGALRADEAGQVMLQVIDALGYAHRRGIIHRDLKPGNIMLTEGGGQHRNAMVVDFGIASLYGGDVSLSRLTSSTYVPGTPAYMAPEYLRGEPATAAVDIYAWGLVFVEALTGRKVFKSSRAAEVIVAQMRDGPIHLPHATRKSPWAEIIRRAVEKDVDDRYQAAPEIITDMEAVRAGRDLPSATHGAVVVVDAPTASPMAYDNTGDVPVAGVSPSAPALATAPTGAHAHSSGLSGPSGASLADASTLDPAASDVDLLAGLAVDAHPTIATRSISVALDDVDDPTPDAPADDALTDDRDALALADVGPATIVTRSVETPAVSPIAAAPAAAPAPAATTAAAPTPAQDTKPGPRSSVAVLVVAAIVGVAAGVALVLFLVRGGSDDPDGDGDPDDGAAQATDDGRVSTAGAAPPPGEAAADGGTDVRVVDLSLTAFSSCALLSNGKVRCWGGSLTGELGSTGMRPARYSPVEVSGVPPFVALSGGVGGTHLDETGGVHCGHTADGAVWCWGDATGERFGRPEIAGPQPPTELPALRGARELQHVPGRSCADMGESGVWCWGRWTADGEAFGAPLPAKEGALALPIRDLTTSATASCAVDAEAKLWCWGHTVGGTGETAPFVLGERGPVARVVANPMGQTCWIPADEGAGNAADATAAESADAGTVRCWDPSFGDDVIASTANAAELGLGYGFGCALSADGEVRCWAPAYGGEEPIGALLYPASAAAPVSLPTPASALAVGLYHACAIVSDGAEVRCWGWNRFGQIGDGTAIDRGEPVVVGSLLRSELPPPLSTPTALPDAPLPPPPPAELQERCEHAIHVTKDGDVAVPFELVTAEAWPSPMHHRVQIVLADHPLGPRPGACPRGPRRRISIALSPRYFSSPPSKVEHDRGRSVAYLDGDTCMHGFSNDWVAGQVNIAWAEGLWMCVEMWSRHPDGVAVQGSFLARWTGADAAPWAGPR